MYLHHDDNKFLLDIVDEMKKVLLLVYWLAFLNLCKLYANSAEKKVKDMPKAFSVDGLKMLRINPGIFKMGSPKMPAQAEPYEGLRKVNITKAFFLSATEVSQAMWERHMIINPSRFQSPSLPVEGITWKEAMKFCDILNKKKEKWNIPEKLIFRLPSEAEWEYAARAGTNTTFFFGESSEQLMKYAWISDNSEGSTKPVGLLLPNDWGFLDIYGNVREWCLDGYGPRPNGELLNPVLALQNMDKVSRGGSWDSCDECCKTHKRMNYGENYQSSDIGFRLALGSAFSDM